VEVLGLRDRNIIAILISGAIIVPSFLVLGNQFKTVKRHCVFRGTNYCQTITLSDLKRTVSWNPETETCPLPLTDAIASAREELTNTFSEADWELFSIAMLSSIAEDKWVYEFVFFNPQGTEKAQDLMLSVVVALDGYVPGFEVVDEDFEGKRLTESDAPIDSSAGKTVSAGHSWAKGEDKRVGTAAPKSDVSE
jgi:hypothetical protein